MTDVTWSSNNPSVASVSSSGLVTGVANGTATITVTTVDGGFSATCFVTVNVPVTDVTLNRSAVTVPRSGTSQLTATIAPANASNQNVVWTSSNTNVATVGTSGLVTVKSNATIGGTTVITVTTSDGSFTDTCTVTAGIAVTGITLNNSTLSINQGSTATLTWTFIPSNATVQTVNWISSNTSVATVSRTGVVTAVGGGVATVTVTTTEGGFTDTCAVSVPVWATGISGNTTSVTITFNETITSADFNPTFAGYSTSVSGNTVIFTRTSGTFQLNTNYFVLVYGSDGTSRTITIKRTGNKSWTVAN